jgi:hypothetical protein
MSNEADGRMGGLLTGSMYPCRREIYAAGLARVDAVGVAPKGVLGFVIVDKSMAESHDFRNT